MDECGKRGSSYTREGGGEGGGGGGPNYYYFIFLKNRQRAHTSDFPRRTLSHLLGHGQAQICACHPCTKRQVMLIFSVSFQLPTTYHMGVSAMTEV